MPARLHRSFLVGAVMGLVGSAVLLDEPAPAMAPPQRVEVHYTSDTAELRWSSVPDATRYTVEISKVGYAGPWRQWTTNSATTVLRLPVSVHPYRDQQGSYRYKVIASNSSASGTRSVLTTRLQGGAVSTADAQRAASKATSCLKQGMEAAVAMGATSGVAAVVTAWIPGVNAVSAGSVAAVSGGAGASTYVACVLPW
ncbi:MAG TPA: hypothetical protein VMZ11_04515 [Mycobacteriales bacterium]|nr:hypothetical protein [Mycobacteriales bacterium]